MKNVFVLLIVLLAAGCTGTYYLTTDDMKEGLRSFISGDGWGIIVATATIRSNAMVPIVFDSYHFSSIAISPSDTIWPGGLIRLACKVPLRSYRSYTVEIGLTPIGRYQGKPIQSAKINWSFSDASYYISHQLWIIEQNDSYIYVR